MERVPAAPGGSRKRLRSSCSPSLPPHKLRTVETSSCLSAGERMLERSPTSGIRSFAGSVARCKRGKSWEGDERGRMEGKRRWEDEGREKGNTRRGGRSWEGGKEDGRYWEGRKERRWKDKERGERRWDGGRSQGNEDRRKYWEDGRVGRGRESGDRWRHRHDLREQRDDRKGGERRRGDWSGGGNVKGERRWKGGREDVRRRQRVLEQAGVSEDETDTRTVFTASLPDQYYEKSEQVS